MLTHNKYLLAFVVDIVYTFLFDLLSHLKVPYNLAYHLLPKDCNRSYHDTSILLSCY